MKTANQLTIGQTVTIQPTGNFGHRLGIVKGFNTELGDRVSIQFTYDDGEEYGKPKLILRSLI